MKKICFLTDSIFSIGGVQRVTAVIAKELAKDYDVTIVTLDNSKSERTELYGLNEVNIRYRYFQFPDISVFLHQSFLFQFFLFVQTIENSKNQKYFVQHDFYVVN